MLPKIFAAALMLAAYSLADTNPIPIQCVSEESLRSALSTEMPLLKVTALHEHEAQSFLAAFNALPPESDVHADTVLVLQLPDAPQSLAVMFVGGCMMGRAALPRDVMDNILHRIAEGV